MPCYSPLHAFRAKSPDPQKAVIVFRRSDSFRGERLDLPCGQCVGCRLERSRQWAVRCMHESQMHAENSFLTLTFSDDHLPKGSGVCGRCVRPHVLERSLCVSTFQDFVKRLRFSIGKPVRYYHCGEYGEVLGRPHYHALLFGYDFDDKKVHAHSNGNTLYTSDKLSALWPFGYAVIGDVTFESAAYVARYVMKKVTGEKAEAHYGGRAPEYTTMSRRPGIGATWFDRFMSDVYPHDRVVVRGSPCRPPRFYDELFRRVDPSTLALLKLKRSKDSEKFVLDFLEDGRLISVSEQDGRRLLVKEEVKKAELQNLKRSLEV